MTRPTPKRFVRAFNVPAVHFAVVGMALFLAQGYRSSAATADLQPARESLVIDARRLAELRTGYQTSMGQPPDPAAESYLVEKEIDDELLYREALRLGLDRADRTVFWRLVEKMKFLGEAHDGDDDDALFQRARAMGLQSKDPVIRQVLVRKVGMLIRFSGDDTPPSEAELFDYYERHPALYVRPQRVSFVHVFFSKDARGERARTDAELAFEALRNAPSEQGSGLGDPFLEGTSFDGQSRNALSKVFGAAFADAVMRAPQGSWQAPIRSPYGFHLIRVGERIEGGRSPLESVRSQVLEGLEQERRDARLKAKLTELRARCDVRVEGRDA